MRPVTPFITIPTELVFKFLVSRFWLLAHVLWARACRQWRGFFACTWERSIQLLPPMCDVTGGSIAIDHAQRSGADIGELMKDSRRNVYGLASRERGPFVAQAHFALAFQYEVDFFLLLVVPRDLAAVRFERYVAERKCRRLDGAGASDYILRAAPRGIRSSGDLCKIRDGHQSTGPIRHGTNSL